MKWEIEKEQQKTLSLQRQIAAQQHQHARVHADATNERECVICLDAEADCLFQECGHIKCCMDCAECAKSCPMCRKVIKTKMKVYL